MNTNTIDTSSIPNLDTATGATSEDLRDANASIVLVRLANVPYGALVWDGARLFAFHSVLHGRAVLQSRETGELEFYDAKRIAVVVRLA